MTGSLTAQMHFQHVCNFHGYLKDVFLHIHTQNVYLFDKERGRDKVLLCDNLRIVVSYP